MKNIPILVGVASIAVIGIFTFSYIKNEAPEIAPQPIVDGDSNPKVETSPTPSPTPAVPQSTSQKITDESGTIQLTLANQDKFNTALSNARKAQLNKNYALALAFYIEALEYKKSDIVYADLYTLQLLLNDSIKARQAIMTAIELKPDYTEYWKWLLSLEKERFNMPFADLKKIYDEGYAKSLSATKVNLVTHFARMADNMGIYKESIAYWELAVTLNPGNASAYEAEIESIKKKS